MMLVCLREIISLGLWDYYIVLNVNWGDFLQRLGIQINMRRSQRTLWGRVAEGRGACDDRGGILGAEDMDEPAEEPHRRQKLASTDRIAAMALPDPPCSSPAGGRSSLLLSCGAGARTNNLISVREPRGLFISG
jgi:hypothetical protein